MWPLHLYVTISDRTFYHEVFIFLEDRLGKQTITFSLLLNNYNPIFNLHKLCGTCSGVGQCIAEKRGIDLSFFLKKRRKNSGSKSLRVCR